MEKYVINLKGLCCEHCGEKIRAETERMEGIEKAEMNVMAQKMTVTTQKKIEEIFDDIESIVHSHERDVEVSLEKKNVKSEEKEDDDKKDIIKIILGAVIFAIGFFVGGKTGIALYVAAYVILGYEVVLDGISSIFKGHAMDENFLMSIATIGAFAIKEPKEAVFVMFFYSLGEFFEELAVKRSRKSIKGLMELCPDKAYVEQNGEVVEKSPEEVNVGEIVLIKAGEKVPLDSEVVSGESELDCSALTGESVPVFVEKGSEILSGSINKTGVLRAKVIRPFGESTVSKILDMVENAAAKKTPAENFITSFSKVYTPIVVFLALCLGIGVPVFAGNFSLWFHRALMFLVVSCPCALVISVPLTYFSGIGEASKKGILIKGSGSIKALTEIEAVVMDKTGTLTEGVFAVERVNALTVSEKELCLAAATAEKESNHPVAKAVYKFAGEGKDGYDVTELAGRGVKAEKDGDVILAGNRRLMEENGITFKECESDCAVIYVAENGKYIGNFEVSDKIKGDSAKTVAAFKEMGKSVYMLTGDNELSARKVAEEVGIEYKAHLLPEDKTKYIEEMTEKGIKTAFVGDGINDAPSLMAAYVGIAMGKGGADAAIEAADCVLMTDEPEKILKALKIAENTEKIVKENIVFAISVKVLVLVLGAIGMVGMNAAVFADVGVALIAILNSMRKKA